MTETKKPLAVLFGKYKTNAKRVADHTALSYPTLARLTRESSVDDLRAQVIDQIARYFNRDAGSVLNELYAIEESIWQRDLMANKGKKLPRRGLRDNITDDILRAMDSEYNAVALDKPLVSFMPAKKFTVVRVLEKDGIAFEISLINSYGEAEKLVVNEVAKLPAALFMVGAIKPDASGPFGDRHEKDLDDPSKEWDRLDELNDLQISRKWQNVFKSYSSPGKGQ
ncbi:hypothetical protein ACLUXD_02115 [Loigolactobacillus coryniformis subsp. coryniformis]|uniref:hypothetical protein n=1 Tax=Loigolactobacillus coryniformis TaxID=1610 RepID=UPI003994BE54